MSDGENRKDLDRTVIRFGGRDYTAGHLVQGALWLGLAVVACVAAVMTGQPLVWVAAGVLALIGVGTALGS